MTPKGFTLILALVTMTGIVVAQQTITTIEGSPEEPLRIVRDLSYVSGNGAGDALRSLDLHLPAGVSRPPMLVWIHGGAWAFGDKRQEERLVRWFADAGIAVASINHRLSPATWRDPNRTEGVAHPAHVQDLARAFAWLVSHADEYGYDPERMFVSGYSSGAHLAALLATDARYLESEGLTLRAIRGAIPVAGAYDIEAYYHSHVAANGKSMADSHVLGVFGESMETLRDASPTSHLDEVVVPMLVISESETYDYGALFEERVTEEMPIEFLHVHDKTHATLFRALERDAHDPTRARIIEWVKRQMTDDK